MPSPAASGVAAWHRLVDARSPDGLDALLSDDAVFLSPIVHTPQVGRAITRVYLTAAFHVLFNDTFRYVREIVGGESAALEFETEIDGIQVNGVDLIRFDAEGRIVEFKVMVRPLQAIQRVHALMKQMLEQGAAPGEMAG
jgi:hypothetical protein